VYDDVNNAVRRVLRGEADRTRLQVYRRGDEWFCTFNVGYDTDPAVFDARRDRGGRPL
jgi:hypothetical protein